MLGICVFIFPVPLQTRQRYLAILVIGLKYLIISFVSISLFG